MAFIPLLRTIIFSAISLLSLIVLGVCAHLEWLLSGSANVFATFIPLGIAVACLSIISLPLFLFLGSTRNGVFTSMILFEIVWFFVLWLLWVGTAGTSVAARALYFPFGCNGYVNDYYGYNYYDPLAAQACVEFTVVEAFAFLGFFSAFIYYDVIFLYAIINAIRGRGIWTASVKEAAAGTTPGGVGIPMGQPQYNAAAPVQYQSYGAYPNAPPNQQYNAYPQQVPPQGPPAQPYNAYAQAPPQGAPQQYSAYPPQIPPQGSAIPAGQNQPYNYPSAPGSPPQQVSYPSYSTSPTGNNAALPPQPNYTAHPAGGYQA